MKIALFDMDGVVVETEHLKAAAHAAAVVHFGGSVPPDLYPTVMGQTHAAVRSAFIRAGGVEIDPEAYTRVYRETYHAWLAERPLLAPGAMDLLTGLERAGYRLGLVTSSSIHTAGKLFDLLGLDDIFSARVFAEDVRRGKPDPEPYRLGMQRLNAGGAHGVAFEDSQAGVTSAAAAGLAVLAVRHRFNGGQDFSRARTVLNSLADTPAVLALVEAALEGGPSLAKRG